MRIAPTEKVERGRILTGRWASTSAVGCNGAFVCWGPCGETLRIIASDGAGIEPWEHVSVSTHRRLPNWTEMAWVKDQFWNDDEVVIQYHPAKADYVNFHPLTLHLWRPIGVQPPTPPARLVGPK